MRPKELTNILVQCIHAREQVLIKGPPAYGKSAVVKLATDIAGCDIITTHPAISDPTDYKGLPSRAPEGDHGVFLPFGELWRAIRSDKPTVFFVDDLGQASETVQKALMQLLHGRRLNGHVLPDHVIFMGATNDVRQMSGVTGIIEPVKSRWSSILTLDGHVDDWVEWAINAGMPPVLVAFMRQPESVLPDGSHLLYAFKPTRELTNSPSPRTWEALGRMLNAGLKNFELFAGAVGAPAATQFWSFLEMVEKCPGLEEILLDPDSTPIPDGASLQCLVATAIGRALTDQNIGQFMRYLWRMPQAFRILTLQDTIRKHNTQGVAAPEAAKRQRSIAKLRETAAYTQWCVKEGALLAA